MKNAIILVLLLSSMALLADGVQPDGSGTEADPYQIATLDNLLWLSSTPESWDSHFIQTADIDASDTQTWNDGEGWSPMGWKAAMHSLVHIMVRGSRLTVSTSVDLIMTCTLKDFSVLLKAQIFVVYA